MKVEEKSEKEWKYHRRIRNNYENARFNYYFSEYAL